MPSGNVKIVRSGILMVREVGELQIRKWLALMVLVSFLLPLHLEQEEEVGINGDKPDAGGDRVRILILEPHDELH